MLNLKIGNFYINQICCTKGTHTQAEESFCGNAVSLNKLRDALAVITTRDGRD